MTSELTLAEQAVFDALTKSIPSSSPSTEAVYNLGTKYKTGKGVAKDVCRAAELYRLAAVRGHAKAQCSLGTMHEYGKGVAKDLAEAARLYRLAAVRGHANGQNNLGTMYKYGKGVAKDLAEAARLYRLAADQGHANAISAQQNLSRMPTPKTQPQESAKK